MKYLLDTNQLIDFFRNKPKTVELFTTIAEEELVISIITFAEYLVEAYKSDNSQKNIENFEKFIDQNKIQIIPITTLVAYKYAKIMAALEKKGQKIHGFDMLIAATAIVNDAILVTDDHAFLRIKELKVMS